MAELGRFWGNMQNYPVGLQNRCTTTVLSRQYGSNPRICAIYSMRETRETRSLRRFEVAHTAAQSVLQAFMVAA